MLHFQMFGLPMFSSTGVVWYLSAMYIGMAILTVIFNRYKEQFPISLPIIVVLFVYGWLNIKRGGLHDPGVWLGHTFVGTLRGIAGIALGAVCFSFVGLLKKFGFNFYGRIFLSILEVCCYLISGIYMWKFHPSYWDFYIVLLLFIGVSISLSELSLFSFINRFNIPFFRKASICILFSHFYVVQYFQTNYPQFTGRTGKLLVIAQVIALSVLNYLLAKLIKSLVFKFVSFIKLNEVSKDA